MKNRLGRWLTRKAEEALDRHTNVPTECAFCYEVGPRSEMVQGLYCDRVCRTLYEARI